jgi:hypothetical protein
MKALLFIVLILALFGCNIDSNTDSTNCCKDHDGVAMCYRPTGASHGHIMCKDGYTCTRECD